MGARHRVGIGLAYRPARLHRLAEFIPWNRFQGSINVYKYGLECAPPWSARSAVMSVTLALSNSVSPVSFCEQHKSSI
jgi:hypothetical protein